MAGREDHRYIYIENVLQDVNRNIALSESEINRNNKILHEVLDIIVDKMKSDRLFANLYRRNFYGGSYYDGLKVTRPNEYDLDLVLKFPKFVRATLEPSEDIPGFVHVHLEKKQRFYGPPRGAGPQRQNSNGNPQSANTASRITYSELKERLSYDNFLSTTKVLSWIQSVLTVAVNEFPSLSRGIKMIDTSLGTFYFTVHEQGPAFTLKLRGEVNGNIVMIDIDLVPCFIFTTEMWPRRYRQNPFEDKPEFFVVPKKLRGDGNADISLYWRLSFQEQESVIITDLQNLKPSLRLIKKLRDVCDDPCIASYYLKTIFLREVVRESRTFWNKPLSYVFMTMLRRYQESIENREILYFWNEENNLIDRVPESTLVNIANRLQGIINDIENHPEEQGRVFRHFATPQPNGNEVFWNRVL